MSTPLCCLITVFIQNPYDEDHDEPDAHIVATLRIFLERFQYPYAVQFRPITSDLQPLIGVEPLRSQSWPELRCGLAKPADVREHSLLAVTAK